MVDFPQGSKILLRRPNALGKFQESVGVVVDSLCPNRPFCITGRMLAQVNVCQDCKNTGIKWQGEDFGLDGSTWCVCPVGEAKRRRVAEVVERSLKKTAYKKTA